MKASKLALLSLLALPGVCCLTANAHAASSYYCIAEDQQGGVRFSWDSVSIEVGHLSFYFEAAEESALNGLHEGGTFNATVTEQEVILRYIQDFVLTKIKLPSGEIVEDSTSLADPESFRDVRRYHGRFPGIDEYRFDRGNKTLSLNYQSLFPPRKVIEQKFVMRSGAHPYPQLVRALGPEEGREIFQDQLERGGFRYDCEEEGYWKSMMRFLLDLFYHI